MSKDTSIGIKRETKDLIDLSKIRPRETYDEAVTRICKYYLKAVGPAFKPPTLRFDQKISKIDDTAKLTTENEM